MPMVAGPHPRVVPLTQVHPSVGTPLQLLSFMGSQVSAGAGPTAPVQVPQALVFLSAAIAQVCEPALHGPFPSWPGCCPQASAAPDLQAQTASLVLSGRPSQSLSAVEVQSRAAGITAPTQTPQEPAVQVCVPRLQIPTLAAGPHACVAPATQLHPSFVTPLQLSSLPVSQVSLAAGPTPPLQAPHVLVFLSAATTQLWDPALQRPVPSAPGCWSHGRAVALAQVQTASMVLSDIPSQLSSAVDVQSRAAA
jgi:hypothetical protein